MRHIFVLRLLFAVALPALASIAIAGRYDDDFSSGSGIISGAALVVGLIHGLPIIFVGSWIKNKTLVILTTVAMLFVAFALGNLNFVIYDLVFIGLSTWFALQFSHGSKKPLPHQGRAPSANISGTTPAQTFKPEKPFIKMSPSEREVYHEDRYQKGRLEYEEGSRLFLNSPLGSGNRARGHQLLKSAVYNNCREAIMLMGEICLIDPEFQDTEEAERLGSLAYAGVISSGKHGETSWCAVAHHAAGNARSPQEALEFFEELCEGDEPYEPAARYLMERYMSSKNPEYRRKAVELATRFSLWDMRTSEGIATIYANADEQECRILGLAMYSSAKGFISPAGQEWAKQQIARLPPKEKMLHDLFQKKLDTTAFEWAQFTALIKTLPKPKLSHPVPIQTMLPFHY